MTADRGTATIDRIASTLSGELGMPSERARALVAALFAIIREDLDTASRFVIPGVLVIDRLQDGSKRRHRVRFVLHLRRKQAAAIKRLRDARRAGRD